MNMLFIMKEFNNNAIDNEIRKLRLRMLLSDLQYQ